MKEKIQLNKHFIIEDNARVTYINRIKNEKWSKWKIYKECNDKEKQQINLASYPSNSILFDRDLNSLTQEEIKEDYRGMIKRLKRFGLNNYLSYKSPHGYHIIVYLEELKNYNEEERKEIKKYYISLTSSDPAKISDRGVVSLPGKPHFKNEKIYDIFEINTGESILHSDVLESIKKTIKEKKEKIQKINIDKDFKNYFEEDAFFHYIKNNIIPDETMRDLTIFPNLAIASIKSGKLKEEIDKIIKPIIIKNFPGKEYNEFEGWYNKALKQEITEYNPFQLNIWAKNFSKDKKDFYDMTIQVEELKDVKKNEKEMFDIFWDKDLDTMKDIKVEWIVDKWIPKGDICFIAGKSGSFKSTLCLHLGYALAEGKLFLNNYKTMKVRTLYLNEENSHANINNIIKKIKKGLNIENIKSENIAFSMMNNIRLDKIEDLNYLIKFINQNKIEVLICDSFRRFIGFNENDATEMNRLFNNLKMLRKRCNDITIVLLHHLKKDNTAHPSDIRDLLRGSSDMVNSADSIIGIFRKLNFQAFTIEHIKCRSSEEMTKKLIKIDAGEDKNMLYMYESDKEIDRDKFMSLNQKCAEEIIQIIKDKELKEFKRSDSDSLKGKYSIDTITKAIRVLKDEEILINVDDSTRGKYKYYIINTSLF